MPLFFEECLPLKSGKNGPWLIRLHTKDSHVHEQQQQPQQHQRQHQQEVQLREHFFVRIEQKLNHFSAKEDS